MLSPTELANTVTAFATLLAGLFPVVFTLLIKPRQPLRWLFVYISFFLTGLATVWYHGYGESYVLRLADTGSNLLVGWALVYAVSGDFVERTKRIPWLWVITVINLVGIASMIYEIYLQGDLFRIAGFFPGELVLIIDAVMAIGLLAGNFMKLSPNARPLIIVVALSFLVGAYLASFNGHQVGFKIIAYHALWHVVGAFGFMSLWMMNHIRFSEGS